MTMKGRLRGPTTELSESDSSPRCCRYHATSWLYIRWVMAMAARGKYAKLRERQESNMSDITKCDSLEWCRLWEP
jgi:hypothetical protein